ncbi:AraC family transcriptional regulator [Sphingobacterium alkalisoli]|uniref:AraC family transcriptional regulator n=1 Tax=Sphingobacterium alkalisoli TaxID=1874115 RepID=A0A4U0H973_9SPHI|nr:AraC family transcriptional regulator [Sphingobacterium alkalisoli]TJY68427.1 AraC family transcriptional regulator [Sphingobacterium alkalisoli]GGH06579.1 transcriptional regulator [Sphingobacterium alkalisoli]
MGNIKADGFKGEKAIVTPNVIRSMQTENPITRQLYVTHIGYYPNARYHYRERPDGAPENILIYCDKGTGWVEYKDEKIFLKENEVFILPANQKHVYGADIGNSWSIYWLHFQGENTAMFDSISGKVLRIPETANNRKSDRMQLFEEIYKNFEMGYSHENMEYITFCLMYLLASLKYMPQYQEPNRLGHNDVIQNCIHYMRDNLENKIALKDIADAVGYSTTHLNALFVQATSFSPIEYYNQLKIQRVCYYLQFSDLKIKEIAFKLGFYDPFHLSKAFFKEMEISPREYRNRYGRMNANSK